MAYKKAVIAVVVLLLVTWVLISSLSAVPVIKNQQQGNGSGSSSGSSGSGSGSGPSTGSLFGLHFPTINFSLPNLNLGAFMQSLFSKLNVKFPNLNLTLPSSNLTANSTSQGAAGGGGGNGGSSTSNNHVNPVALVINPQLLEVLIILFGMIAAILVVTSVVKKKKKQERKPGGMDEDGEEHSFDSSEQKENLIINGRDRSINPSESENITVSGIKTFNGWKGEGLIKPDIPYDMPLLAKENENLNVSSEMPVNSISLNGTPLDCNEKTNFSLRIGHGSNQLFANTGDREDHKEVFGIDPIKNSTKQLSVNLGENIINSNTTRTLREMSKDSSLRKIIKDPEKFNRAIRKYEKLYYGKQNININEYYDFLRYLRDSLYDPKMYL